jgi:hypothetical protein
MQVHMRQSAQRSRSLMVNAAKIKCKARALLANKLIPRTHKVALCLQTPQATAAATTQVLSCPAPALHVRTLQYAQPQRHWEMDMG